MAPDNETKSPAVEAEEKETKPVIMEEVKMTDVEPKTTHEDVEKITIEKEPRCENLTEKIEDQNIAENKEIAKAMPEITQKNADELVVEKNVKEAIPDDVSKKQEEPNVIDDASKSDPIVSEKVQPVPADEITMKKEAEIKKKEEEKPNIDTAKETFESIKIEEPTMEVKKDDVSAENDKEDTKEEKTVEALETKQNGEKDEPKEEKSVDETKVTDSTTKEEEKNSPKQSNSLMGKVKKSFFKAKKAITWKNNTNTNTNTNTSTKNPETKEDHEKA